MFLHFFGLFVELLLHELHHYLKSCFRRLRISILCLPRLDIFSPCSVDVRFPSILVGQCIVCLPGLEFSWLWLWLDFQDTPGAGACCEITSIVVKPRCRALQIFLASSLVVKPMDAPCRISFFSPLQQARHCQRL